MGDLYKAKTRRNLFHGKEEKDFHKCIPNFPGSQVWLRGPESTPV
jgi:hypothetical protein